MILSGMIDYKRVFPFWLIHGFYYMLIVILKI